MNRLQEKFNKIIIYQLQKEFNFKSIMQVPKIEKIVINIGVGDAINNPKILEKSLFELSKITGQKPIITKAKKSIASFKLRAGMPIGCKVTLRSKKMYDFLDKLISISLPRIRDFQGLSYKSFDQHGNYTIGIKEQIIFPEINFEEVEKIRGMEISIVTTTSSNKIAFILLQKLGLPFKKQRKRAI